MTPRPAHGSTALKANDLTSIRVQGARENNLKNVDLTIPRDAMVVFTGLSGSGKSSLAFDTIFAEGQRRYVESLSSYARMFLGQVDKPDVDFIEGLSPAVSIDQKSTSNNPRSTVGTITEIYDYLRLLCARIGHPALPRMRRRNHPADPAADRRRCAGVPRTHPPAGPRTRRAAARKGEFVDLFEDLLHPGLLACPRGRRNRAALRPAQARQAVQAHHRGGRRPHRHQARAFTSA